MPVFDTVFCGIAGVFDLKRSAHDFGAVFCANGGVTDSDAKFDAFFVTSKSSVADTLSLIVDNVSNSLIATDCVVSPIVLTDSVRRDFVRFGM